ncbi:MAG: ATP-dependent Clp protease proteolytic subunit [Planctomycetota bacterium]
MNLELVRLRKALHDTFVEQTGRSLAEIEQAHARNATFAPDDAVTFGLIDRVVKELPSPP